MTNLIDRTKLPYLMFMMEGIKASEREKVYMTGWNDAVKTIIHVEESVDAIPVEWLRNKQKQVLKALDGTYTVIDKLIAEYHAEMREKED